MQILRTCLLLCVATGAISAAGPQSDPVLVTQVVNGNTIVVQAVGRVTLSGVHAPALGSRLSPDPVAARARDQLISLVLHRYVRLEYPHASATGAVHGGPAYVVLEDGTFVNAVLARQGLARVTAKGTGKRDQDLQHAEQEARAGGRGLWTKGSE